MHVERVVYTGCVIVLFAFGILAYFIDGTPGAVGTSAFHSLLIKLTAWYLMVLVIVSPMLAVWYFNICWKETRVVSALIARKNLLVR